MIISVTDRRSEEALCRSIADPLQEDPGVPIVSALVYKRQSLPLRRVIRVVTRWS